MHVCIVSSSILSTTTCVCVCVYVCVCASVCVLWRVHRPIQTTKTEKEIHKEIKAIMRQVRVCVSVRAFMRGQL